MDSNILLSITNTKLRDFDYSLEDVAEDLNISVIELCDKLDKLGYTYNSDRNQFLLK
jgi:phosphate uptake regulator